jgi:uncharacterized peroxidase-related enzyme
MRIFGYNQNNMPFIQLEQNLHGVTGLLEFRKDAGRHLRELTQILLRGESTLSEAERELIAMAVSDKNECVYCTTSHAAAAQAYLQDDTLVQQVKDDINTAGVSEKMKALLKIALQVQQSGKNVTQQSIDIAKAAGASDRELHDTVMIAALFCFYNRYVDGLGTYAPTDPEYYKEMADRLKNNGYYRPEAGYDNLKNKNYE